jgi:hypothetical protein
VYLPDAILGRSMNARSWGLEDGPCGGGDGGADDDGEGAEPERHEWPPLGELMDT